MKIKILTTAMVAMLFVGHLANAQEVPIRPYKHEFGFDASRVLNSIFQVSNFNGLMYRYHTKKNSSFRIRANFDYNQVPAQKNTQNSLNWVNNYLNTNTQVTSTDKNYNLNSQFRIGWQKNKDTKNMIVYMGTDIIIGVQKSHLGTKVESTRDDINSTTTMLSSRSSTDKTFSYGLSPFGGVSFKLNSRIKLTVETSIDLFAASHAAQSISADNNTRKDKASGTYTSNNLSNNNTANSNVSWNMNFVPLNILMLSVGF